MKPSGPGLLFAGRFLIIVSISVKPGFYDFKWLKTNFKKYMILDSTYGRRQWQPTPVFLPGKSHGQRSLVCYSPWGCKESDMTEQLHFQFLYNMNSYNL